MEKEFNLKEARKKIPQIVNVTDAVAYHTGVKNTLEVVEEQDKEFIKKLNESFGGWMLKHKEDSFYGDDVFHHFRKHLDKLAGDNSK